MFIPNIYELFYHHASIAYWISTPNSFSFLSTSHFVSALASFTSHNMHWLICSVTQGYAHLLISIQIWTIFHTEKIDYIKSQIEVFFERQSWCAISLFSQEFMLNWILFMHCNALRLFGSIKRQLYKIHLYWCLFVVL